MWADYVSDRYLPADVSIRALIIFEWTHRVGRRNANVVIVNRPLHRGRAVPLDSADLRRDSLRYALREKLDLLFYGTLNPLELSLDLWSFRAVAESALDPSFRDVLPHLGEWRGFVYISKVAMLHRLGLLPYAYRTFKNARSNFWSSTVHIERRARQNTGCFSIGTNLKPTSSAAMSCKPIE